MPTAKFSRLVKRGEVKETWELCPRCGGKQAKTLCERCLGEGRVLVDPMTVDATKSGDDLLRERVTGEDTSVRLRRQRDDRELRRLELAAAHREGRIDPREKEQWESAKLSLYRSGSFVELDQALTIVQASWSLSRVVLEVAYGPDGPLRVLSERLEVQVTESVVWVAGLMPDPIIVPGVTSTARGPLANGHQVLKRNKEIARLHYVDGLNAAQIGRRLGVDRSTVSRVLRPPEKAQAA